MALTGELQDIGLVNLVQMLCLEQRKAMLSLQRRGAEEGLIYFAEGQVVHALVGPHIGPEAVYKLLSWPEGSFKVTEALPPHRTIAAPWNSLLMEGLRQADEQKLEEQSVPPKRTPTATETAQDSALEHSLILLLSHLEQLQAKLADPKIQKRPVQALQILSEVVNEVVAYCETHPPHAASQAPLSEALVSLSDKYTVVQLLRVHQNRLSTDIVTQLYEGWAEEMTKRQEIFTEISRSLLDVLDTYFTHLTVFFHASALADQWQEMCQVFLAELKRVVEKIQF